MPFSPEQKQEMLCYIRVAKLLEPDFFQDNSLNLKNGEFQKIRVDLQISESGQTKFNYFFQNAEGSLELISEPSEIDIAEKIFFDSVRDILLQKRNIFQKIKYICCDFKARKGYSAINQNLEIDGDGYLQGSMQDQDFDPDLMNFTTNEKIRFRFCFDRAFYETYQSQESFQSLESERYLIEFGAENFAEYCEQVFNLKLLEAEHIEDLNAVLSDSKDSSPAFFHKFLLKFNELRAIVAEVIDKSRNFVIETSKEFLEKNPDTKSS